MERFLASGDPTRGCARTPRSAVQKPPSEAKDLSFCADVPQASARWLRDFRRQLAAWYKKHARLLPWRETADPYRIWISEIMLQQTTVTAVIPYFERFFEQFPTIVDLANAPEEAVLRAWEGLGYYSRARNIHKTARILTSDREGNFPSGCDDLQELPGIGRYTAGAIASFAFDKRAPILEANTLRLYCRLLGFAGDPRSAEGQRLLWNFAEQILPQRAPGLFNQALMELGATVCTPEQPACDRCPVRNGCMAFAQGAQSQIPQPARRPEITAVTEAAIAVCRDGRYLLMKRPLGERWAGLWDFPRFVWEDHWPLAVPTGKPSLFAKQTAKENQRVFNGMAQAIKSRLGLGVSIKHLLAEIRHSVTRYRITLRCFLAECHSGTSPGPEETCRWLTRDEIAHLPLSVTGRKLAKLLPDPVDL